MGTTASLCKVHEIPTKQEEKEWQRVLPFILEQGRRMTLKMRFLGNSWVLVFL